MPTTAPVNPQIGDESPSDEDARLAAESAAEQVEIDRRIATLVDEGFGDALGATLGIILDPTITGYSTEKRSDDIVTVVLGMIANRELQLALGKVLGSDLLG